MSRITKRQQWFNEDFLDELRNIRATRVANGKDKKELPTAEIASAMIRAEEWHKYVRPRLVTSDIRVVGGKRYKYYRK